MSFATDNRWSPGASGAAVPEGAVAAYGARWIDMGDGVRADVLPDRQGFAYNDGADRDALIERLMAADAAIRIPPRERDETVVIPAYWGNDDGRFHVAERRAGGYVYVAAWLDPVAS